MAIRNIQTGDAPCLYKIAKPVKVFDEKLHQLLDDMAETMYYLEGVGLAAPQVGVLRRVVVVDIGDESGLHEFINPEIIEESGEDVMTEGCLSVPGSIGEVKRPTYIKVRAVNRKGEEFEMEAHDYFARAICHEVDHLNGTIFVDKAENVRPKEAQ